MVYGDAERFRVLLFRHFLYIDGWVSVSDPMCPICKIGCILEICLFFEQFGIIVIGHKIKLSRNRDSRNSEVYFEHPRTKCFEDPPPRPGSIMGGSSTK